ncbi:hypothetical protein CZ771_13830 [Actinomycetales bacterium JB111]|nr:hypothetical protein CZ771_13830 [Actinomycetales bacterium JB111]
MWLEIVVLFCLPPLVLAALLGLHAGGIIDTTAECLVPVLFLGGLTLMAVGWVPDVVATARGTRPVGGTNTLLMWVTLVAGLATWAAMPVVLVLGGTGPFGLVTEPVAASRQHVFSPAWIAFLTWPLAALGVYGLVRFLRRRTR